MATCIFNIDLSKLLAPRYKTDESGPVCAQTWSGAPTRGEKYIQQGPILPEIVTSQFVHNMAALHANLRYSDFSKSREPEIRRHNPLFFLSQIVSTGSAWF